MVRPMPGLQFEQWLVARAAAGMPLPEPEGAEREAVTVTVHGVEVGGAVLAYSAEPSGRRCAVLLLQTTVPDGDARTWTAIADALAEHARVREAVMITTAVAPALAAAFGNVGFRTTMIGARRPFGPTGWAELQDAGQVIARPMDLEERRRFVAELRKELRAGMARAGVAEPGSPGLDALEAQFAPMLTDPLPDDLLVIGGVIDGDVNAGIWARLVQVENGAEAEAYAFWLAPEYRGRGLVRSFLGALNAYGADLGIHAVRGRAFAFDQRAQQLFGITSEIVEEIHLRKDIAAEDAALR